MKSVFSAVEKSVLLSGLLAASSVFAQTPVLQGWGAFWGSTIVPPGLSNNVIAISSGGEFSLALRSDGVVIGWGNNDIGQATPPTGLSGVIAVSAGHQRHSLALKSDGTVIAWGNGAQGQTNVPSGLSGVVAIDAGFGHNLALTSNGVVSAWGWDIYGQCEVPSALNAIAIAAGNGFSVAVRQDGSVTAWGNNGWGNTNVPSGAVNVSAISATDHVLALKSDGMVVAWGRNDYGQATVPPGLSNVVAISAGGTHSLALKADGTLVAWGFNRDGQSTVPFGLTGVTKIAAGSLNNLILVTPNPIIRGWGFYIGGGPHVPPGLSNGISAVACGGAFSLALRSDGTVVAWGNDYIGETTPPAGLSDVVAIAAANQHSLALKSDGTVVAWGYNGDGESTVPPGLQSVVAIDANHRTSIALKSNGSVAAWGYNGYGECNVPADLNDAIAVAVGDHFCLAARSNGTVMVWGLSDGTRPVRPVPPEATNVIALSASDHVLALRRDGTVVAWGRNDYGQANVPPGLSDVVKVVAGMQHSIAVRSDGSAVAWGRNDMGQASIPYRLWGFAAIDAGQRNNLAVASGQVTGVPLITQGPSSQSVVVGGSVTFTVTAVGDELTYTWLKNGAAISGANSNALTISGAQLADAGEYQAVVSNGAGSVMSAGATLTVAVVPSIVTQPRSLSRYKRGMYFFDVVAAGTPPLTYAWYKDGAPVPNGTSRLMVRNNASEANVGEYRVIVSNSAGSITSAPASLVLLGDRPPGPLVSLDGHEPPEPLDDVITMDASALHALAVRANGTVKAWTWSGVGSAAAVPPGLTGVVAVSAGDGFSLALKSDGTVVGWGDRSGASVPAGLSGVVAISAGILHSVALKQDGSVVRWGGFNNPPLSVTNGVAIGAGFNATAVLRSDGTIVTASSVPVATDPLDQYVDITWGSYLKSDGTIIGTAVPLGLSNVVEISGTSMALRADGSVATWGVGTAVFSGFSNVTAICGRGIRMVVSHWPVIVRHPTNATVQPGSTATLSVIAKGQGTLSYQWLFNGVELTGETNTQLVIANAEFADSGDYTVRVSNSAGYVLSSSGGLSLFGVPHVTMQPVGQLVFTGAKVGFSVTATGAQPLQYQWYHGNVLIPGATSSALVLPTTSAADAGNYSVIVSNYVGYTASALATLAFTGPHTWPLSVPGTVVGLHGPAVPPNLTNIIAVAAGDTHALAIRADSTLAAWGCFRPQPGYPCNQAVAPSLSNVVAVHVLDSTYSPGYDLALRADGTVVRWVNAGVPNEVAGAYGIISIDGGLLLRSDRTVMGVSDVVSMDAAAGPGGGVVLVKDDGSVVISGMGWLGAVNFSNIIAGSMGSLPFNYTTLLRADGRVIAGSLLTLGFQSADPTMPGVSNVVAVAAGYNYGLALRNDGTVTGIGIDVPTDLSGVTAVAAGGFGLAITTNPPQPHLAMTITSSGEVGVVSTLSVPNYILESASGSGTFSEVPGYTNAFYTTNSEAFEFKVAPDVPVRIFRLRKP